MDTETRARRHQAGWRSISETFPLLDQWRERSKKPEQPEQHSELEIDSRIWQHHPPYEVARQSLIAAVQHLNLARTAIVARELFPTAHFTVLRGALVGSAQAVWLLISDDRSERQQRAFRIIDEWYQRRIQYNEAIDPSNLPERDQHRLRDQTQFLKRRRRDARRRWQRTGTLTDAERPTVTQIIGRAASEVFTEPAEQQAVRLLWKSKSGDAHAQGWSVALRGDGWTRDSDGLGVATAGGDIFDIAQPYIASFRLLRRGWSLFDRRAEGSDVC